MGNEAEVNGGIVDGILIEWQRFESWNKWMAGIVGPLLRPGAEKRMRRRQSELRSAYSDDDLWLDDVLPGELTIDVNQLISQVSEFPGVGAVVAAHGTRLPEPGIIHREGIALADWKRRRDTLEGEISRRKLQEPDALKLRAALEERLQADVDIDTGKWFAMLDSRVLQNQCGHYLLLGSEWLAGLLCACGLPWQSVGYPTIYKVAVPLEAIPDYATDSLARDLLREWVRLRTLNRNYVRWLDHALILRSSLPAKNVLEHYHPARIVNPHAGCRTVRNSRTRCPACVAGS